MNKLKSFFETRTSVRRYERKDIPMSSLEIIYAAIRNTPTSYNGQQFSVVDVTSKEQKEALYKITNQKQIKTCSHFFVFCADYNKVECLAKNKKLSMPEFRRTLDAVLVGVIDASLAMQNAVMTAQVCGLGSCCVGYTRTAHPHEIAELLKLPKGVFVVCGLTVGVPSESPDIKPKQSLALLIHKDYYHEENMEQELANYDKEIAQYNKTRSGQTTDNYWCEHMLDYYKCAMEYNMKDYLERQGFSIEI